MFGKKRLLLEEKIDLFIRKSLFYQISGYLQIELGEFFLKKGFCWLNIECDFTGGIDIYISDEFSDLPNRCDELMIGHYHEDDLLWLVLNINDEIVYMKSLIIAYVHRNYEEDEDGRIHM